MNGESKPEKKFQWFTQKFLGRNSRIAPDAENTLRNQVAELRKMILMPDRNAKARCSRRISQANVQSLFHQFRYHQQICSWKSYLYSS